MILSDEEHHDLELFVAAFSTRATKREASSRALLEEYDTLPASTQGHIDVQQLWTFPMSRDRSYYPTLPVVRNADNVRSRVKSYLAESRQTYGSESGLAAGKVVWVALRATDDQSLSDQQSMMTFLDNVLPPIQNGRSIAGDCGAPGRDRWTYQDRRLPCVIVGTELPFQATTAGVYPQLTLVPLVHEPALRGIDPPNPAVHKQFRQTVPGIVSSGNTIELELFALTQLLLTVDHRKDTRHVYWSDAGLQSWSVSELELDAIYADVYNLLGI